MIKIEKRVCPMCGQALRFTKNDGFIYEYECNCGLTLYRYFYDGEFKEFLSFNKRKDELREEYIA